MSDDDDKRIDAINKMLIEQLDRTYKIQGQLLTILILLAVLLLLVFMRTL